MSHVTIVMYHYVRDLKRSKYPAIKSLDLALFKEQIKYIKKYNIQLAIQSTAIQSTLNSKHAIQSPHPYYAFTLFTIKGGVKLRNASRHKTNRTY